MSRRSIAAAVLRPAFFVFALLNGFSAATDASAATCLRYLQKSPSGINVFHTAADGSLLIGAWDGLYRRVGETLRRLREDVETGAVRAMHEATDGVLLILADNGLFRSESNTLVRMGSDIETGAILALHNAANGVLLVPAERGLFRRDGNSLVLVDSHVSTGQISALHDAADGVLLIGAEKGLFRHNGNSLIRVGKDVETGWVNAFHKAAPSVLLIETAIGLFRRDGDALVRTDGGLTIGRIHALHEADDGTLLIAADHGLFRHNGDRLVRMGNKDETGRIAAFHKGDDGALLIIAQKGLFRLSGDRFVHMGNSRHASIAPIDIFYRAGNGELLIGARYGLFRRDGDNLIPVGGNFPIGTINAFHKTADGMLLVGADAGLFRRDGDDLVPVDSKAMSIHAFHKVGNTLLIDAGAGLFELIQQPWAGAKISEAPSSTDAFVESRTVFVWKLVHPCGDELFNKSNAGGITVIKLGGIPQEWVEDLQVKPDTQNAATTIRATFKFPAKNDLPHSIQLLVREDNGEFAPLGAPFSVRVGWKFPDYVKYYGVRIGGALSVVHAAIFILLILGARWSAFCWRVLTDPIWGKAGSGSISPCAISARSSAGSWRAGSMPSARRLRAVPICR